MEEYYSRFERLFVLLGKERFEALLEALLKTENNRQVLDFSDSLVTPKPVATPLEGFKLRLGGQAYKLMTFRQTGDERWIRLQTLLDRANRAGVRLGGEEDGQNFLGHQRDIPEALFHGFVTVIFPNWRRHTDSSGYAAGSRYFNDSWTKDWHRLIDAREDMHLLVLDT